MTPSPAPAEPPAPSGFSYPGRATLGKIRRSVQWFIRDQRVRWQNQVIARRAKDRPLLFVLDSALIGLFAHLATCLIIAHWAAAQKRKVVFVCLSPGYRSDHELENWLPEILRQGDYDPPRNRRDLPSSDVVWLRSFWEFPYWRYRRPALTLATGKRIFQQTFQFAPTIQAQVDEIAAGWTGFFMVGLHYRGTDKKSEATPVSATVAIERVQEVLAELRQQGVHHPRVFVATDDAPFLAKIREALGDVVITREHITRSGDGTPIHLGGAAKRGNHLAFEAMVDAILLARCAILVRTASYLSGFSALLAERQLVFMLNRPYAQTTWFPDSEVIKCSARFENLRSELAAFVGDGRKP